MNLFSMNVLKIIEFRPEDLSVFYKVCKGKFLEDDKGAQFSLQNYFFKTLGIIVELIKEKVRMKNCFFLEQIEF